MEAIHKTQVQAKAVPALENPRDEKVLVCRLRLLPESPAKLRSGSWLGTTKGVQPYCGDRIMEFHIRADIRSLLGTQASLFRTTGNLILPDFLSARVLAEKMRTFGTIKGQDVSKISAGNLNAMALIDEILHLVFELYRETTKKDAIREFELAVIAKLGRGNYEKLLKEFGREFPPRDVYRGVTDYENWLASISRGDPGATKTGDQPTGQNNGVSNRELVLEEMILLRLANENPAFAPFRFLFDDGDRKDQPVPDTLTTNTLYLEAIAAIENVSKTMPTFGPTGMEQDIISLLRLPAKMAPNSLAEQLAWIKENWGASLETIKLRILTSLDLIKEEQAPRFPPGPGPVRPYDYRSMRHEYEKFSPDSDWMPSLVLIAKNVLVWFHQLSESYGRPIVKLDDIPDEELDVLARRGINGLWLIGIWQRSRASEKIKKLCGNPEAAASAYALYDYDISDELGGWPALDRLRERCLWRGIRLAADMVPNHTGIDSDWVRNRPELFMGLDYCPYPSYTFNGPDLSDDPNVGIWLEDHYYSRSDAAVVFKRMDKRTGKVRYIYHGNDGTGMAWNDTAQIDFLNPEARTAVREKILHVAQHFSIIRFDAAMVLAKQHIRRLWYPAPGAGGAIPSRSEFAMSDEAFDKAMPNEFWREVVDECAVRAPDTLLLAEAFWMMEGYFVRTLGMHRVYNSAFMNMLKDEKNSMYRLTIKNTQEFDRQILKRYVNFMSNPDEETAINQFGAGDKYFGVCTMMVTMPGLPMFGHGQIEGFTEKYGMEYRRSYRDEKPNLALIERHEREIFPLVRMRRLFAEVDNFYLYDFYTPNGYVDENVFAYSNGLGDKRALVFYNNHWERTSGKISLSCQYAVKDGAAGKRLRRESLIHALDLDPRSGNYLVVQEVKSGLSYVYSCAKLQSDGWPVALEGYEAKVFVDFVRVHDFDGSYARLYEMLDSKGIPDLDSALEEASRPELYRSLMDTLSSLSGFVAVLRNKDGDRMDRIQAEIHRTAEVAEKFFSRLAQAMAAGDAPEPSIDAATQCGAKLEAGMAFVAEASFKMTSPIARVLKSDRALCALLYYCFVLATAEVEDSGNRTEELRFLLDKFLLRKKMTEALCDGSKDSPLALDRIDKAALCSILFAFATRPAVLEEPPQIVSDRTQLKPSASGHNAEDQHNKNAETPSLQGAQTEAAHGQDIVERSVELLRWARVDAEARSALGINAWEGVEYFNQEKLEATLELAPLLSLVERYVAQNPEQQKPQKPQEPQSERQLSERQLEAFYKPDIAAICTMCDTIKALEEPSGFKIEQLIDLLVEQDKGQAPF